MDKTVAIVQARLGSTRLPGKVLRKISGKTMLERVVDRVRRAQEVDDVVIATSSLSSDQAIVDEADRLRCSYFRGSERDVLDRYYWAARQAKADRIVRITADCPLIDPGVVDRVVMALEEENNGADYASNVVWRTFPAGLDTEVMCADTLERIWRRATSAPAREHVTVFVRERPELFSTVDVVDDVDRSELRWTVDTAEDLQLIEMLVQELRLDRTRMDYRIIADYQARRPSLRCVNAHIEQKPYWIAQGEIRRSA